MAAKNSRAYAPVENTSVSVRLIQALNRGDATPQMQQDALKYIINTICRTYDMSYHPESDRDTSFAEGRRFVGLQLVKLLSLLPDKLDKPKKE